LRCFWSDWRRPRSSKEARGLPPPPSAFDLPIELRGNEVREAAEVLPRIDTEVALEEVSLLVLTPATKIVKPSYVFVHEEGEDGTFFG